MKPRMSDVAREAGVALVTVSRVLNTPEAVTPATRQRVQEAVRRLGYVQDLTAGSLASSRSRIVGAVVPTLTNAWFADTMEGLASELAPAGYQLMLAQSQYHEQSEQGLVQAFLGRRVDALVLTGDTHEPSLREQLAVIGIPVLETWSLPEQPLDMAVGFSNEAAGRLVGEYLRSRAHRRIGFIGADEQRSLLRLQGLRQGFAQDEVTTELVQPPSNMEAGRAALAALLAREPDIDAVFCSNDILAVGALLHCREQGITVPTRLAVVGFSDLPMAQATWPALTTVRVDAQEIGRVAGRMLLQRLMGNEASAPVVDLGFSLIQRSSS
jgi:LacI family gluconate utilization system Gnt-I transcriptional repressor